MSASGTKCPKCGGTAYIWYNENGAYDDRLVLKCPSCKYTDFLTLVGNVRTINGKKQPTQKNIYTNRYWND